MGDVIELKSGCVEPRRAPDYMNCCGRLEDIVNVLISEGSPPVTVVSALITLTRAVITDEADSLVAAEMRSAMAHAVYAVVAEQLDKLRDE